MWKIIEWFTAELGINFRFKGQGADEVLIIYSIEGDKALALKPGQIIVALTHATFALPRWRPLLCDPSKAKTVLGWVPKTTVEGMRAQMVSSDLLKA